MARIRLLERTATVKRARALRADSTPAEKRLWAKLRAHRLGGWRWKRQAPFGPYFLDFLCVEAGLVVELDGGQHAEAENVAYDERRSVFLASKGLRVLRFWNPEVLTNLDGVCQTILDACGGERGPSLET